MSYSGMVSYYITEIEKKLIGLGIGLEDQAYNQIFAEQDDKRLLRRLRAFNELLNQKIDQVQFLDRRGE